MSDDMYTEEEVRFIIDGAIEEIKKDVAAFVKYFENTEDHQFLGLVFASKAMRDTEEYQQLKKHAG